MSDLKGTNVMGGIVPFTEEDTYPTHYPKYGKGGFRTVATIAEMHAIPTERREKGMEVYCEADEIKYKLQSGLTNSDWKDADRLNDDIDTEESDVFYITDAAGNAVAKIDKDGLHTTQVTLGEGDNAKVLTKEAIDAINPDLPEEAEGKESNYKGEFIIADATGNAIAKINKDGLHTTQINLAKDAEIIDDYEGEFHITDANGYVVFSIVNGLCSFVGKDTSSTGGEELVSGDVSNLRGKKVLVIGNSLTSANQWQLQLSELLGAEVFTHAMGGSGMINWIDGMSSRNWEALDPYILDEIDAVVILGPYNNRSLMGSIGSSTDIYPTQSTLWGQFNYVIKSIYDGLVEVDNLGCKLFWAGVHAYGAYDYNINNAYEEYPEGSGYTGVDFAAKLKEMSGYNGIEYIDLFNNSGINSHTWDRYQASSSKYSTKYIGYLSKGPSTENDPFPSLEVLQNSVDDYGFISGNTATVEGEGGGYKYDRADFTRYSNGNYVPWMADQLHCSSLGYELIGKHIASCINKFF